MNRKARRAAAKFAKQGATIAAHGITRDGVEFAAHFTRSRKSRSARRPA